jgi:hypothetical protein
MCRTRLPIRWRTPDTAESTAEPTASPMKVTGAVTGAVTRSNGRSITGPEDTGVP